MNVLCAGMVIQLYGTCTYLGTCTYQNRLNRPSYVHRLRYVHVLDRLNRLRCASTQNRPLNRPRYMHVPQSYIELCTYQCTSQLSTTSDLLCRPPNFSEEKFPSLGITDTMPKVQKQCIKNKIQQNHAFLINFWSKTSLVSNLFFVFVLRWFKRLTVCFRRRRLSTSSSPTTADVSRYMVRLYLDCKKILLRSYKDSKKILVR